LGEEVTGLGDTMVKKNIYWGDAVIKQADACVDGEIVEVGGESFYRVTNYDRMPPFLMSVVSSSDHWMFVSSTGGLTCGRGNPDKALFPYETDDKIHDSAAHSGPRTCLLVEKAGKTNLWKPFSSEVAVYDTQRNLYKSLVGNQLIFEEINHDLALIFSYSWSTSDRFGFVKTTRVRNTGSDDVAVEVLDGFRNLLPAGISQDLQSRMSTLADAYKKSETDEATGAAIFSLSSIPSDRAEPCESLKASIAWCLGLPNPEILLSEKQMEAFCTGLPVNSETAINGQRGAYFVQAEFVVPAGAETNWHLLADVDLGPSDIPLLLNRIARGMSQDDIDADIEAGTRHLWSLVSGADGCQVTSNELVSGRHFANTLFNIMRGGTFFDEYNIRRDDFMDFVSTWNIALRGKFSSLLASQKDPLTRNSLLAAVESAGDEDMKRLVLEYLPLCFSRRHGDPSRPWNKFSIDIKTANGSEKLHYQGNWRDIFQNWEALAISYPEFVDSFITKFVNASTVDGYNPYRIGSDGIDWEVPDAEDAWSNIGYWGDHQVNYLSRLLELSQRYHPERIAQLLDQDIFVYADVPYRLKSYQALLNNPRDSIEFDQERERQVADRVSKIGADGKLVTLADGSIYRVRLLEKLLVTVLCKLGNFVPGGGIWMNTQRPEWNDANNALAGFGLSMVTLAYLRRLLETMARSIRDAAAESFAISTEVLQFFTEVERMLVKNAGAINETTGDSGRKDFMDEMGVHASDYRERVYEGFSGRQSALEKEELLTFIDTALAHLDHSLELSRRPDGLFHSYNLIQFGDSGYGVKRLPEMLEGQVAVLSSGFLQPRDGLELLDALRKSRIYRSDQHSYLLYPDKELPSFLERNLIPQFFIDNSPQLRSEMESGCKEIIEQDINGHVHFNSTFMNVADLRTAMQRAGNISKQDEAEWCEIYDAVFKHREFTGRSSTMYKYEGLGCIYWHMVSKLLLAVSEFIDDAREAGAGESILERLTGHFENIRDGLGLYKSPAEYGAIPLDPYSHTPGFSGAQQPGMTGQVKEDIITRFRVLGVVVRRGSVSFEPRLLKRDEFVSEARPWHLSHGDGLQSGILEAGCLAFSLCGTPVIYRLAEASSINVYADGELPEVIPGTNLGNAWSLSLFKREKRIRKILVDIPKASIK
jgi:hypothetical protein